MPSRASAGPPEGQNATGDWDLMDHQESSRSGSPQVQQLKATSMSKPSQWFREEDLEATRGPRRAVPTSFRSIDDLLDQGIIRLDAAKTLLARYKHEMTPHYPFVIVPEDSTVDNMRHEKPFLLLAIITSASYDNVLLQKTLQDALKRTISELLTMENNLPELLPFEVLQGLLVFLAWGQYLSRPRRYSQFLHLAVSILIDIRLDQPPQTETWKTGVTFTPAEIGKVKGPRVRGREEQRALAGCYFLVSNTSVMLQKTYVLSYSTYLEHCCDALQMNPEYDSDQQSYYLIRLSLILERISRIAVRGGPASSNTQQMLASHVATLQSELEAMGERCLSIIDESPALRIHLHTTELYLYQIALLGRSPTSDPAPWPTWKHNLLTAGLISSKLLFTYYLALPPGGELAFSNNEWVSLGFATLVTIRLCLAAQTSSISMDTARLREDLNLQTILDRCCERMDHLTNPNNTADERQRDVWYHFGMRVRLARQWFLKHSTEIQQTHGVGNPISASEQSPISNEFTSSVDLNAPSASFDDLFGDAPWFSQLSGPDWDFNFPQSMLNPAAFSGVGTV
ncbi:MAG: hypothetical protein M1828_000820 [Chrysothrix sp. TS-e1954]|nr:MAG: hypothetical protein M1828_000820 [Chrysothrix sp. TS-e1954]